MSAGPQIDWGANVPIYDPNGQLRAIPQTQAHVALAQPGAKLAVPMVDTQGVHHWVGQDQVRDAVANGGRISYPSQQIPKWFGFTPSNVASNVWQGAKGTVVGTGSLLKDLVSNPNWFEGPNSTYEKFIGAPAEQQVVKAGQELQQPGVGPKIAAAGHALASAIPLAGPWAAGVGEQAGTGDIGGVAGQVAGAALGTKAMQLAATDGKAALNTVIPSTTRTGAGLSTLETVHAAQPVTPVLATDAASDIAQRLNVTGERPYPLIQTFQDRMNAADLAARHPEIAQGLADRGIPTNNPLTFAEARTFLKRANELKYDSNIGQSAKNQLSQFANALDQDISAAAQQGGFGDDYAAMRNEYRRGSKIIRTADQVGPFIGAGLGYEVGRRMGEPIGGTIIGGMAGKALAKPVIGGLVRSVIERDAGPPQLSPVPSLPYRAGNAAGTYLRPTPPSPAEYTRTILNAKEGNISPGYADTLIKRAGGSTKVSPIDRSNVASTVSTPPIQGEVMDSGSLVKLATGYTDEGFKQQFGFPPELSMKTLENQGFVTRNNEGLWEINGRDALRALESKSLNTRKIRINPLPPPPQGGSTKVSPIDRSNVTPTVNAPPPPVRSAPISADEPPLPPNTVRVNVEGEDRMVKLSDDQMQKWNEAQARFQSSQDWARRSFANDPQEMQARLKGIGMRYAAEKRAITGQLTGRENAAIRARQATNYVGKPISLRGQNATVLGTAFGRIKVRLADGTTTTALPEDIDDPLPLPPQ